MNEQIKNEEGSNDLTNSTKTKINSDNLKEGTKKENGAAYKVLMTDSERSKVEVKRLSKRVHLAQG